jgi:hypothetical protein
MKDKYLHTFRRQPGHEFTNDLFRQIEALPLIKAAPPTQARFAPSRGRRLNWAVAILVAAVLFMAAVPGVRARFEDIIKQVGGLTFLITEDYPGAGQTPRIVPDDIITLEEARTRLDFEFSLPDYVPEGLTLQDDINDSNIGIGIRLTWLDENQRGRILLLSIEEANPDVNFIVGPDSLTEVMVNGQTASLIRGGWYVDTQSWQDDGSRMLRWDLDGIEYTLQTGNEEWGGISDEELIKIAESISPPIPAE